MTQVLLQGGQSAAPCSYRSSDRPADKKKSCSSEERTGTENPQDWGWLWCSGGENIFYFASVLTLRGRRGRQVFNSFNLYSGCHHISPKTTETLCSPIKWRKNDKTSAARRLKPLPGSSGPPSVMCLWRQQGRHSKWCMSDSRLMSSGLMSVIHDLHLKWIIYQQLRENIPGRQTDGLQPDVFNRASHQPRLFSLIIPLLYYFDSTASTYNKYCYTRNSNHYVTEELPSMAPFSIVEIIRMLELKR